jgi:diguanylate cyclase (GGDEF)-like protein
MVAMADLDHFKRINDSFGHAVGDKVLVQVAAVLSAAVREGDLVARIGGEEFVLVAQADDDRSMALCEQAREAVNLHDWHAVEPGLAVSLSMGFVVWHPADGSDMTAGRLLDAADRALYAAKAAGRNRVVASVHGQSHGRDGVLPVVQGPDW